MKSNIDMVGFSASLLGFQESEKPKLLLELISKDENLKKEVIELMEKSIDRGIQLKKDYHWIHKKNHITKWINEKLNIKSDATK